MPEHIFLTVNKRTLIGPVFAKISAAILVRGPVHPPRFEGFDQIIGIGAAVDQGLAQALRELNRHGRSALLLDDYVLECVERRRGRKASRGVDRLEGPLNRTRTLKCSHSPRRRLGGRLGRDGMCGQGSFHERHLSKGPVGVDEPHQKQCIRPNGAVNRRTAQRYSARFDGNGYTPCRETGLWDTLPPLRYRFRYRFSDLIELQVSD